jgi:hypothetical protein
LRANSRGFYSRWTIQGNKVQWQKEFGKGILGTLPVLAFFDLVLKFEQGDCGDSTVLWRMLPESLLK